MIEGAAGCGKTSLALGLIERTQAQGISAVLVSDDQAYLSREDGKLIARVPETIAGKAELRGYGIIDVEHIASGHVSLVVQMKDDDCIERLPEPRTVIREDLEVPAVDVPIKHEEQAARIVLAWIKDNSFT